MGNERVNTEKLVKEAALQRVQLLRKAIERQEAAAAKVRAGGDIPDIRKHWPVICDMLCCHLLKDGPEEGMTITMIGTEEGVKLYANVKPIDRSAYFVAGSLQEAMQALENHLTDPDAKWPQAKSQRPWRGRKQKGRQRH